MRCSTPLVLMLLTLIVTWLSSAHAHPDLLNQIDRQTSLIKANPNDVDALLKRGDLYRRHQEYELSAADFRSAREIAPTHHLLNWYEGLLALDTFDYDKANRLFTQYLEDNGEHAAGWYWRGQARAGMAQFGAAADDFARAIETNARPSPVLYRARALALVAAGPQQAELASVTITQGLEHFPREVNLLGLAVDLSLLASDTVSAVRYISRLDSKLRELPQWQFRQASWHCIAGNRDQAREAFKSLLSSDSQGRLSRSGTWIAPLGLDEQLQANPEPARCVEVMREYLLSQRI